MEFFPMMGHNDKPQKPFFYAFNLDDLVPQDHLLSKIDHFLDLSDLRQHLEPHYSHTGQPSVDPELMIRMLIIGYCLGIQLQAPGFLPQLWRPPHGRDRRPAGR